MADMRKTVPMIFILRAQSWPAREPTREPAKMEEGSENPKCSMAQYTR